MKEYDIHPIGDRVFVKRDSAADMTPGGIALPDNAKVSKRMGTVVAVGPGAHRAFSAAAATHQEDRYPMQCKIGDRVLLPGNAEIISLYPDNPDSEVVVCQECQLLAILR